jgi:hypothetical protein
MTEHTISTETERRDGDLEKGDHAVRPSDLDQTVISTTTSQSPTDTEASMKDKVPDDSLSRTTTSATQYADDPFALYPTLSVSMSSTRGPVSRRNTVTTLSRPLTRQETINTLKSVRSRFTEVRSEFDESVSRRAHDVRLMIG